MCGKDSGMDEIRELEDIIDIGNQAVTKAMEAKNWELAVQLRGKSFQRNLETYRMLTRCRFLHSNIAYFYTYCSELILCLVPTLMG